MRTSPSNNLGISVRGNFQTIWFAGRWGCPVCVHVVKGPGRRAGRGRHRGDPSHGPGPPPPWPLPLFTGLSQMRSPEQGGRHPVPKRSCGR